MLCVCSLGQNMTYIYMYSVCCRLKYVIYIYILFACICKCIKRFVYSFGDVWMCICSFAFMNSYSSVLVHLSGDSNLLGFFISKHTSDSCSRGLRWTKCPLKMVSTFFFHFSNQAVEWDFKMSLPLLTELQLLTFFSFGFTFRKNAFWSSRDAILMVGCFSWNCL